MKNNADFLEFSPKMFSGFEISIVDFRPIARLQAKNILWSYILTKNILGSIQPL